MVSVRNVSNFLHVSPTNDIALLVGDVVLVRRNVRQVCHFVAFENPIVVVTYAREIVLIGLVIRQRRNQGVLRIVLYTRV